MEEVAVKQGFLYLQQQHAFGKVGGARQAGAGQRGWRLLAIPGGGRRYGIVGIVPSTVLDPELKLGRVFFSKQPLATPTRPQTVLFADAAPCGGREVKEGATPLSCLSCSVMTSSHGVTLEGNGRNSGGDNSELQERFLPLSLPQWGTFGWC